MDDNITLKVTELTGAMELKPVEYKVESGLKGPWWWRQTRYWVQTDFGSYGDFDTWAEAEFVAKQMRG